MSGRDELRGTLSNTICNASNYTKRAQPHLLGSDMSIVLDKTADAILAAGYRRPRTIATVEELDALPIGSAVQTSDSSDVVVLKGSSGEFHNEDGYELPADVLWRYGTRPFTVLYDPSTP